MGIDLTEQWFRTYKLIATEEIARLTGLTYGEVEHLISQQADISIFAGDREVKEIFKVRSPNSDK